MERPKDFSARRAAYSVYIVPIERFPSFASICLRNVIKELWPMSNPRSVVFCLTEESGFLIILRRIHLGGGNKWKGF